MGIVHTAIIFGEDGQAQALARQLRLHHWQVKMATISDFKSETLSEIGVEFHKIEEFSAKELRFMGAGGAGAQGIAGVQGLQGCRDAHPGCRGAEKETVRRWILCVNT